MLAIEDKLVDGKMQTCVRSDHLAVVLYLLDPADCADEDGRNRLLGIHDVCNKALAAEAPHINRSNCTDHFEQACEILTRALNIPTRRNMAHRS